MVFIFTRFSIDTCLRKLSNKQRTYSRCFIRLVGSDMMRWQPAVFQFYISVLIFCLRPKYFKYYLLLLLSATYFYSGLNKFNLRFINFIWGKSILIDLFGLSPEFAFAKPVKAIGFIIPLVEILSGILILSKWKKYGFYIIIFIHIFVLFYVGPLGLNLNSAVWSWNLLMICYAVIYLSNPNVYKPKINLITASWMVLIYVLPLLNFMQYYYPYFAFDLYSGSRSFLYLNLDVNAQHDLVKYSFQNEKEPEDTYPYQINLNYWSGKNLNVPFTHSLLLYKRFKKSYPKPYPNTNYTIEISHYPYKSRQIFE